MKKNMGNLDKAVRIGLAVVVGILYAAGIISGTVALVLGALAVILTLTSLVSFCPLYLPFGIRTNKGKKAGVS